MILKDEDVRKRTLRSSHIAANSDAQDQSMTDNSLLTLMHKIETLIMIITQILCNGLMIAMMTAKNVMILNNKKPHAVSCLQVKAALHQLIMLKKRKSYRH